jgi:ADP-ribose 1''-phosphate phosphatase
MSQIITYVKGDLFTGNGRILAHACNCHGSWGAGVAVGFKTHFPSTYSVHQQHCHQYKTQEERRKYLLGKCQLIPIKEKPSSYVACLFTSDSFGGQVDGPPQIVQATKLAMEDLVAQLKEHGLENEPVDMPKINAGLFRVPWSETEKVLKEVGHPVRVFEL